MKPNTEDLNVMPVDLGSFTPEQRNAPVRRAVRRAHAERARALAEMCMFAGSWLRSAISALLSWVPHLNLSLHMPRLVRCAAAVLAIVMVFTIDQAAAGKVPGLHIYPSSPPGYGKPRVPRVVRGFNPKQHVQSPKKDIGLAHRR